MWRSVRNLRVNIHLTGWTATKQPGNATSDVWLVGCRDPEFPSLFCTIQGFTAMQYRGSPGCTPYEIVVASTEYPVSVQWQALSCQLPASNASNPTASRPSGTTSVVMRLSTLLLFRSTNDTNRGSFSMITAELMKVRESVSLWGIPLSGQERHERERRSISRGYGVQGQGSARRMCLPRFQ